MRIREMQGTSAYLEYIGPKGRKRKSSCAYYLDGKCDYFNSITYKCKCVGRMYCSNFDDSEEGKKKYLREKKRQRVEKSKLINEVKKRKIESHPLFNKKLIIQDVETGREFKAMIVHPSKENLKDFMFSSTSNIGKAFIGCKVNSIVKFKYYGQKFEFRIIEIG